MSRRADPRRVAEAQLNGMYHRLLNPLRGREHERPEVEAAIEVKEAEVRALGGDPAEIRATVEATLAEREAMARRFRHLPDGRVEWIDPPADETPGGHL